MGFLPITREELIDAKIGQLDFIVVTGDAYVDHPSFGTAIIGRVLEHEGYKVGILSMPDTKNYDDFKKLGKPKYAFFIGSGNIDSMVLKYTVAKKIRRYDPYLPKNRQKERPDRALTVYCKILREIYPDVPQIIGGLEASLRRFAHYDYWSDSVRPSIMVETGADLLTYGMGENATRQIARRLVSGEEISSIHDVLGTCYLVAAKEYEYGNAKECASFEVVKENKKQYAISCRIQYEEQDHIRGKKIIQKQGSDILVQNKPMPPLTTEELDEVYDLPYMRTYHPYYEQFGGVDAIGEMEFSITHNRGCFGSCNFCALAFHQGRYVTSRSHESVIKEAKSFLKSPDFKGYISDVGGPTANFRDTSCEKQKQLGLCKNKKCLAPIACKNLHVDHEDYLQLLRELRTIKGIKKVFIRSGIRYDYLILDKNKDFMNELIQYHISGQLRVAPEHCSAAVLDKMGKPYIDVYKKFTDEFYRINELQNKNQYVVPYLMSSHPGSTVKDAVELACFLKKENVHPDQVQDFYPTPGTISTCMFYTGIDPYTMEEVYVPRSKEEKAMQRALLQWYKPENRELCIKALHIAGRYDLIGTKDSCLIKGAPANNNIKKGSKEKQRSVKAKNNSRATKATPNDKFNDRGKRPYGKKKKIIK